MAILRRLHAIRCPSCGGTSFPLLYGGRRADSTAHSPGGIHTHAAQGKLVLGPAVSTSETAPAPSQDGGAGSSVAVAEQLPLHMVARRVSLPALMGNERSTGY